MNIHDFVGVDVIHPVNGLSVENYERAEATLGFEVHLFSVFLGYDEPAAALKIHPSCGLTELPLDRRACRRARPGSKCPGERS